MKIVADYLPTCIELNEGETVTLVVEHKGTFLRILHDLYNQSKGIEGDLILSEDGKEVKVSKRLELVSSFVPFDLNEKRLITRINNILEREALDGDHYNDTMRLLAEIEKYVNSIAGYFPFPIVCQGINANSLIKMCSVMIEDDGVNDIDRVLNYISIINDLFGDRLFVLINMTMFFTDEDIQGFITTCNVHKYQVLLIDGVESNEYKGARRLIIDKDLCTI